MIKVTAFVTLLALRILYHPATVEHHNIPFASPAPPPAVSFLHHLPATLISFNGTRSDNKITLQWAVEQNETADQFEVERSLDGISFKMAALVFGTDKTETGQYMFFEKAANKTVRYRIRMISKDHHAVYSPIVEINPAV